jgi:hypothetical protein
MNAPGLLLALSLAAPTAAASANARIIGTPRWIRTLAAAPQNPPPLPSVLLPLPDGSVLVRKGKGVLALTPHGATSWSMPNVTGAILDGRTVIFRRSDVVFAVRSSDAAVLWKRPCTDPKYTAVAGDRIVTVCGGVSTVLRARDGRVLARHAVKTVTGPTQLSGARSLNDDYVLVANFFDGAWMGYGYYVVDAHTGAFLWSETDCDVVAVTSTTISLTPYPSMLPWANAGVVQTRRLADGSVVDTRTYAVPADADATRGHLAETPSATYVVTWNGALFRFPGRRVSGRQTVMRSGAQYVITSGEAAFVFVEDRIAPGPSRGVMYVDRPSRGGTFETRQIGSYTGALTRQSLLFGDPAAYAGVVVPSGIAVAEADSVALYDTSGSRKLVAPRSCTGTAPVVAATRTMLFVRCAPRGLPATLTAFARRS